jgi:hypothetical protein
MEVNAPPKTKNQIDPDNRFVVFVRYFNDIGEKEPRY